MTPRQLGDLINRLGPALVLYARQWAAAPEDVVQDAFLKLVESRRPPDDPAAWLFAVVRNRAMDLAKADRRRVRREQAVRPDRWFVEPEIDGLDAERAVHAAQRPQRPPVARPVRVREDVVVEVVDVDRRHAAVEVAGDRQVEELPDPHRDPDLDRQ